MMLPDCNQSSRLRTPGLWAGKGHTHQLQAALLGTLHAAHVPVQAQEAREPQQAQCRQSRGEGETTGSVQTVQGKGGGWCGNYWISIDREGEGETTGSV